MATEKRLIDANALVIEDLLVMDKDYINEFASGVRKVMNAIRRLPIVDAVEVVHGRWVLAKPRVKGRNATYRCTVCGKLRSSYYNDVFQWEYCPCGAKMDGDGNG